MHALHVYLCMCTEYDSGRQVTMSYKTSFSVLIKKPEGFQPFTFRYLPGNEPLIVALLARFYSAPPRMCSHIHLPATVLPLSFAAMCKSSIMSLSIRFRNLVPLRISPSVTLPKGEQLQTGSSGSLFLCASTSPSVRKIK